MSCEISRKEYVNLSIKKIGKKIIRHLKIIRGVKICGLKEITGGYF